MNSGIFLYYFLWALLLLLYFAAQHRVCDMFGSYASVCVYETIYYASFVRYLCISIFRLSFIIFCPTHSHWHNHWHTHTHTGQQANALFHLPAIVTHANIRLESTSLWIVYGLFVYTKCSKHITTKERNIEAIPTTATTTKL